MLLFFHGISFRYENALKPVFDSLSASFPVGWTGVIGANGTGKTTLLRLACGELEPQQGFAHRPPRAIYCAQRTDFPPGRFERFIASTDGDACQIRGRLTIGEDWLDRWDTLSHGERKRAEVAVALWESPDVLAMDEPTNHIDADTRQLLIDGLKLFRGIGLLVSHDREMLDSLCRQCLVIDPPNLTMRPGGYTQAVSQARQDEEYVRREHRRLKAAVQKLAQEAARRRREAGRADRLRSKRGLDPKDHDTREKLDRARVSGKDGQAGRLARQLDGRLAQLRDELAEIEIARRYDMNFWLPGSCSPRRKLFALPEGSIELGGGRRLSFPELFMSRSDRIAVTGPNGAGKTTLIRHIYDSLSFPMDKVIYLPQEIDVATSRRVMAEVNSLPRDRLGHVMTVVSCLGSRPERLIGSVDTSPGEMRKVLLALGVTREPYLVIMDEPTNHLDLPAIECLENALDKCPCGLLLVSHDYRFLSRLARVRWHLSPSGGSPGTPPPDYVLRISDTQDMRPAGSEPPRV